MAVIEPSTTLSQGKLTNLGHHGLGLLSNNNNCDNFNQFFWLWTWNDLLRFMICYHQNNELQGLNPWTLDDETHWRPRVSGFSHSRVLAQVQFVGARPKIQPCTTVQPQVWVLDLAQLTYTQSIIDHMDPHKQDRELQSSHPLKNSILVLILLKLVMKLELLCQTGPAREMNYLPIQIEVE